MKKFVLVLLAFTTLTSCIIHNPRPENCVVETAKIVKIVEGSSFDIVFRDDNKDSYYINRSLELGLNLDSLNAKVLNKTVTLHLPQLFGGLVTSEHIAQLKVGEEIIFTEFK